MKTMKKITEFFTVIIFMLVTSFVVLTFVQNFLTGKQAKATTTLTDNTQLTKQEEEEVNKKILEDWGTPTPDNFIELNNSSKIDNMATSGEKWYYLTEDIGSTAWNAVKSINSGHIRILLNGYSISNHFRIQASGNGALSIFDKIPNKNGKEYKYNSNAEKYYQYNEKTKRYEYSKTKPTTGVDVTNLPTWKKDTYIKVTGSAISPNQVNSTTQGEVYLAAVDGGLMNVYGIHFVGCRGYAFIFGANEHARLNAYQCKILGNIANSLVFSIVSALNNNSKVFLQSCSIYGNLQSDTEFGIQPANINLPNNMGDILVLNSANLTIDKCNIGVLAQAERFDSDWEKIVYLKDVDLGQKITLTGSNFESKLLNLNGASGNMELVHKMNFNFIGNSPNLNFIVHGKNIDSDATKYSGSNTLSIEAGATINALQISGTLQIEQNANLIMLEHKEGEGNLIDGRKEMTARNATTDSKAIIKNNATVYTAMLKTSNFIGFPTKSIAFATMQLEYTSVEFNGKAHQPKVTVSLDDTTLTQGTDYTIEYSDNIQVGTASVTVKGMDSYNGSRKLTFKIVNKVEKPIINNNNNNKSGVVFIILGIILGVIVLAGIAVFVFLLLKKKAKDNK